MTTDIFEINTDTAFVDAASFDYSSVKKSSVLMTRHTSYPNLVKEDSVVILLDPKKSGRWYKHRVLMIKNPDGVFGWNPVWTYIEGGNNEVEREITESEARSIFCDCSAYDESMIDEIIHSLKDHIENVKSKFSSFSEGDRATSLDDSNFSATIVKIREADFGKIADIRFDDGYETIVKIDRFKNEVSSPAWLAKTRVEYDHFEVCNHPNNKSRYGLRFTSSRKQG